MKRLNKVLATVLASTMMATMVAGCAAGSGSGAAGGSGSDSKVIKIGSVHPLTGNYAYEAQSIINSQKLAIEEINAAGGITSMGGAKLELVVGDSQASADTGCFRNGTTDCRGMFHFDWYIPIGRDANLHAESRTK